MRSRLEGLLGSGDTDSKSHFSMKRDSSGKSLAGKRGSPNASCCWVSAASSANDPAPMPGLHARERRLASEAKLILSDISEVKAARFMSIGDMKLNRFTSDRVTEKSRNKRRVSGKSVKLRDRMGAKGMAVRCSVS